MVTCSFLAASDSSIMRRIVWSVVFLVSFAFAAELRADENVRTVQTKLKAAGFYFGEVDGALSSDVSAAITRYQIRNGLQISGNLNPETSKALGVKAEVTTSAEAPSSETWRSLRKSDLRVATKPKPVNRDAAAVRPNVPPSGAPTAVVEPNPTNDRTVLLSPERLRDYIGAFVLAGIDPQVGAELEFFANRVRYYDDGFVGRDRIRADLRRYDARWPERRFRLAGEPSVQPQANGQFRATFPLRFELANGSQHSSGKVQKTLLLQIVGRDLEIVAVNERKIR